MNEQRRGTGYGALAYLAWGLFPLYWPLLEPAGALEVLSHRVVWSLFVVGALLAGLRRWAAVAAVLADRGRLVRLALGAVVLAVNWGTYIYGVQTDHVVETSLGYFINPLVTVLLGVLVLGERLRPVQWGALAGAAVAVLVLSVENGRPPWLAIVLALSFGSYGLLKKTANVGAVESLAVETAVLAPLAALYLLLVQPAGTFTTQGPVHVALLVGSGVITAGPLLLFGAAATRVPLTTLGLLQYLAPTIQFLLGVLVRHEPMGLLRLSGFGLVWLALAVFTADLLRQRRALRLAVEAPV